MVQQIFVNFPVADLPATKAFWEALGFSFNPLFTNEKAACLVLGDNIFAMLLTKPFFSTFISKTIVDARTQVEAITALSVDSRERVDALVAAAVASGGTSPRAAKDHGFMYQHDFEDLDGHVWEVFHMSAMPTQPCA